MKIKDLYIYPVKGLKGVRVEIAQLTQRGFARDRRWMLVDSSGTFLSQRSHPTLATYSTAINIEGEITITKDSDSLTVSPLQVTDKRITAAMWENRFEVHVANKEICDWWSQQLGEEVLMTYMKPEDVRIKEYIGEGDRTEVSMADGYPYLIVGTASLSQLNNKLESTIFMNRFRGNIIVETIEPHIEDSWNHITIGGEKLYVVKPCARCQVITVNQETGDKGKQPLATLSTYRKVGNKVNFGANAVANSDGVVKVGDVLQSIEQKK